MAEKAPAKKAPARRSAKDEPDETTDDVVDGTTAQGDPHADAELPATVGAPGTEHESFAKGTAEVTIDAPAVASGPPQNRRVVSLRSEGGPDGEEVEAPEAGKPAERTVWAEVTVPNTDQTTFILLASEGVMVNPGDLALLDT